MTNETNCNQINNVKENWLKTYFKEELSLIKIDSIKQWDRIICFLIIMYGFGLMINLIINMFSSADGISAALAGFYFILLQTIVDTTLLVTLYVMIKNRISLKFLLVVFTVSLFLNKGNFIVWVYNTFLENGLYLNMFIKEGHDGKALQYARVLLGLIIILYALFNYIFNKRTVLKTFMWFFNIGLFLAMTAFHAQVVIYPKNKTNEYHLEQMKIVLDSKNVEELCREVGYSCTRVKDDEYFYKANIDEDGMNPARRNETIDAQLESMTYVVNDIIKDFRASKDRELYLSDEKINTQFFRSVLLGFKKYYDNSIVVISDSTYQPKTANFYVLVMGTNTMISLAIWMLICLWAYGKHIRRNERKQLDGLLN